MIETNRSTLHAIYTTDYSLLYRTATTREQAARNKRHQVGWNSSDE